ncbi:MAG TPA: hypothetical protein VIT00_03910 [Terrimicrobiaceae bacterium]
MDIDNRFASRAEAIDEIPEPFRRNLRKQITPDESVSFLAYAPAYKSLENLPATVLAITDQQWLIVEQASDGDAIVNGAPFGDTLLVELTEVLLFGRLRIDSASDGAARSGAVHDAVLLNERQNRAGDDVPVLADRDGNNRLEIQGVAKGLVVVSPTKIKVVLKWHADQRRHGILELLGQVCTAQF